VISSDYHNKLMQNANILLNAIFMNSMDWSNQST